MQRIARTANNTNVKSKCVYKYSDIGNGPGGSAAGWHIPASSKSHAGQEKVNTLKVSQRSVQGLAHQRVHLATESSQASTSEVA